MSEKITSAHIRAALSLRYQRGSHVLLFEVANATGGAHTRYADAVAFGMWPSHGHEIEGIEIKVSRADFLNEMKQPEKSQPVYQYCDRWWLAVPKGLVAPEELPATWGLMELVGDSMRVKKKAQKLEPIPPTINFLASLLRRAVGPDEEAANLMAAAKVKKMMGAREAKFDERVRNEVSRRVREAEAAMSKLAEIKEATGIDLQHWTPTKEVIACVKYVLSQEHGVFNADAVDNLRRSATSLIEAIDQLPRVVHVEITNDGMRFKA